MNYSNFRISLDIHDTSSQTIIKMKKGDTGRRIMIALRENSNAYQIEEGCTAVFTAVKPDGNLIYNECTISENVIIYTITEQTANVLGNVNCEIKLYDKEGVLITSPSFIVYVLDPVFFWGNLPESANEYKAFANIAKQYGMASYQLTADSKIDSLVDNGRYYCIGSSETIQALLNAAGAEIPSGDLLPAGFLPRALFVDVTTQERRSNGPEDVVGMPTQHLTVYIGTMTQSGEHPECYVYEYDRVCNLDAPMATGASWGKWYHESVSMMDIVDAMPFVAEYGVTTLEEIQAAVEMNRVCVAKNNESHHILPLVSVAKGRMAEFSGIVSGTLHWVRVTSDGWTSGSESYDKSKALDEDSTDDQIPSAKAVYDLVTENKCVFIAEYGVTTASEVREALRAGKACFAKKEIYYIPLLEADGYFFEFSGFYDTMNYHYSLSTMGWEDNSTPLKETTMLVHITSGNGGAAVTADKTYAEIKAAHDAGKLIEADCNGTRYAFSVSGDPSKELFFKPIYSYNNMTETAANFVLNKSNVWSVSNVNMPTDKHIIKLIQENAPEGITEEEVNDLISAKVAGVLTVNFSIGSPTTPASADKTYAEIKEALNSGNTVEGRYNGKSFVYAGTNRSGDISFKQPVYMNDLASVNPQNNGYLITIKSDNNVTFETIAPWGAAQELVDGIPQADWDQSDPNAKDYVKNRTHYDTRGGLNNSGNYAFSASGDSSYPYVATVVSHHSEYYKTLYVKTQFSSEAWPITVVDSPSEIVSGTDTCYGQGPITLGLVRENLSGAYLIKAYATMDCSSFEIGIADGVLKQLDEKFIPDTIARKADIPPASPVVWVNATLNGESVTADRDFNYLMANFFTDKVIMCKLSDPYNRWLLVCDYYNSDDAIFAFNPICVGALDGAFPGISCSPVGWTYSEV